MKALKKPFSVFIINNNLYTIKGFKRISEIDFDWTTIQMLDYRESLLYSKAVISFAYYV